MKTELPYDAILDLVELGRATNPGTAIDVLLDCLRQAIEHYPEWTSVKDKMPENHQHVIISGGPALFKGGKFYCVSEPNVDYSGQLNYRQPQWEVTHWMPYPVVPNAK